MPEVIDLTSSSPTGFRQPRRTTNATSSPPPRTLRRRSPFRTGRSYWGNAHPSNRTPQPFEREGDISEEHGDFEPRLPALELNSPGQELSPGLLAGSVREMERYLFQERHDQYASPDHRVPSVEPSEPPTSPPATTRRPRSAATRPVRASGSGLESTAASSRQTQTTPQPTATSRKRGRIHSTSEGEDVDKHQSPKPPSKKPSMDVKAGIIDMIDVENDDDVQKIVQQQMLKAQLEEGNARRKIADFNCVICLDEPTDLSTTPCGHLFCNECIKTTLRFGNPQAKFGKCPVCRGKVNLKDIIPLELRLLKFKGKGKA